MLKQLFADNQHLSTPLLNDYSNPLIVCGHRVYDKVKETPFPFASVVEVVRC